MLEVVGVEVMKLSVLGEWKCSLRVDCWLLY